MSRGGGGGDEIVWKWVIIGNSGVGKTSILSRLCDDEFTNSFISTIGIDFKLKKMTIGGKTITIQLWDTAGQERFGTITKSCYRGCNAAILVYDVCSRKSFQDISKWVHEISMNASDNVCTMLLGNKCDFDANRDVDTEEAADLASKLDVPFAEVSAKTGQNIQKAFTSLVEAVLGEPIQEKASAPPPPKPASKASEAQQQRMGRLTKMFSWASSSRSQEDPPSTLVNPNQPPQMPQGRHNSVAAVTPIRSVRGTVKVLERSKSTTEVLEGRQRKVSRTTKPEDRRRRIHVGDIPDDESEEEDEDDDRSTGSSDAGGSSASDEDGQEAADSYNDSNNNDNGGGGTPIYVFKRGNNPRFNSMKKKVISRVSDPDIIKLSGLKSSKQQAAGSSGASSLTQFDRPQGEGSKCSC